LCELDMIKENQTMNKVKVSQITCVCLVFDHSTLVYALSILGYMINLSMQDDISKLISLVAQGA